VSAADIPNHLRGTRKRSTRPERIDIGTDILVRNDIFAASLGCSEKTLTRADKRGAPYAVINGCKYRPESGYNEYLAAGIVRLKPPVPRRRGRR
jgi:hypothetical protein